MGAFAGTYNFSTATPTRYDALLGYVKPDFDLFVRHYSTAGRLRLGHLVADAVYRHTRSSTYGIEVNMDCKNNIVKCGKDDRINPTMSVGAAWLVNGYVVKAKANLHA